MIDFFVNAMYNKYKCWTLVSNNLKHLTLDFIIENTK